MSGRETGTWTEEEQGERSRGMRRLTGLEPAESLDGERASRPTGDSDLLNFKKRKEELFRFVKCRFCGMMRPTSVNGHVVGLDQGVERLTTP